MADMATERAVLAGLVQYGTDVYLDIADIISTDSFTDISNKLIFKCVKTILDQQAGSIDIASIFSVANEVGYSQLFEKQSEVDHLRSIANFAINKENVKILAVKLKKLQISRELIHVHDLCKESLSEITGNEKIDEILSMSEGPLFEYATRIAKNNSDGPQRLQTFVDAYIDYLICNPNKNAGISTGYPLYDKMIGGGLRRKTVNLVAARPKIGKTQFGDNVGLFTSYKLGLPTLMLDSEMSKEDHINRMLANISGVKIDDIESGIFIENEISAGKVDEARKILNSIAYDYISIAGMPFEEIISVMRRWVTKTVGVTDGRTNDCVLIYDYLKLMSSNDISAKLQEYQVLGFQITELHNFTVKYDVPCLSFIQLNRDGIDKDSSDGISGSDRIAWLCSNLTFLKKKTPDEIAEDKQYCKKTYNRKLIPVVARHGAGLDDGDYINMNLHGEVGRLVEGVTRNQLHELKAKNEGFEIDGDSQQF